MVRRTSFGKFSRMPLMAAVMVGGLALASRAAFADGGEDHARLVGAWSVQVTLRNCATGAPLGPALNALVTFHHGGTVSESTASPAFAVGQRGPATGTWRRTGTRSYAQRMVALIAFDTAPNPPASPGFFAGWQTITQTLELVDRDHFTSAGTNESFDLNGQPYRSGCSTAVGRRFE